MADTIQYKPIPGLNETSLNKIIEMSGKELAEKSYVDAVVSNVTVDISNLATKSELGAKVDKEEGKGLSTEDFTTEYKNKLEGLNNTGVTDEQISTAINKYMQEHPISGGALTSEQEAKLNEVDNKVDKVLGKGLSTEDFTTEYKNKLEGLSNSGVSDAQITTAIENYMQEHPVSAEVGDGSVTPAKTDFLTRVSNNMIDKYHLKSGYINADGSLNTTATGWYYTDFLEIEPDTSYYYSSYYNNRNFWYDENKNKISSLEAKNLITSPSNAKYVRLSFGSDKKDKIMFLKSDTAPLVYEPYAVGFKYGKTEPISKWENRKIVFIGDSITFFGTYHVKVAKTLGMNYQREAISGSTVADTSNLSGTNYKTPMCDDTRLANISSDASIIVLMGGTNDFGFNIPIGDKKSTDKTTYYGAMRYILNYLSTNLPNAMVFVCNQLYRDAEYNADMTQKPNTAGHTLDDYREATKEISREFGTKFIDIQRCGINASNKSVYLSDDTHPSDAGGSLIAQTIISEINKYMPISELLLQ